MSSFILLVALTLQVEASPERRTEKRDKATTYTQTDSPTRYSELTIGPRVSIVGGTAIESEKWSDFLSTGIGVEAQYSYLWRLSPSDYLGIYGGISYDNFAGRSHTVNDPVAGPIEIDPDSLGIVCIEAGIRGRTNFSGVFLDSRFGFGVALYQSTDATFTVGGASASDQVIASSAAFMFNGNVRFGVILGKASDLAFGIGYQMNGAPKEGDAITGSFKAQSNIVLSLTLNINF